MIEIIKEFQMLRSNLSLLIDKSGFKGTFLAEQINILQPNFVAKKRKGNWSEDEMEKILKIIENERINDIYLAQVMKERENEPNEMISFDDFKKAIA